MYLLLSAHCEIRPRLHVGLFEPDSTEISQRVTRSVHGPYYPHADGNIYIQICEEASSQQGFRSHIHIILQL